MAITFVTAANLLSELQTERNEMTFFVFVFRRAAADGPANLVDAARKTDPWMVDNKMAAWAVADLNG